MQQAASAGPWCEVCCRQASGVAGIDRDREPLEALAASAREQDKADDLLTIQTDLTSDAATEEITKATRGRFGRIDILVNNAGIGPGAIRRDGIVNLSGRGMLLVSVARQLGSGNAFARLLCYRSSRAGPEKGALGPLR